MRYSENFQGLFSCQTQELAKLSFAEEEPFPLSEEFDTSFMENFNVILPGWRTGVEETIVAFLVHRKLF